MINWLLIGDNETSALKSDPWWLQLSIIGSKAIEDKDFASLVDNDGKTDNNTDDNKRKI